MRLLGGPAHNLHASLACIDAPGQVRRVRCPGDTIHFMGFGYEVFIERLIELAGNQQPEDWKPYESWSPY